MITTLLISCLMAFSNLAAPTDLKEGIQGYQPAPETVIAKEQFRDAKFGVFIHWGVYSMLARGEWVMNVEKIPYSVVFQRTDTPSSECVPPRVPEVMRSAVVPFALRTE